MDSLHITQEAKQYFGDETKKVVKEDKNNITEKEDSLPSTQNNNIKESGKRPISDSIAAQQQMSKPRSKRKNRTGELDVGLVYGRDPEISSGSIINFSEFKAYSDS